MSGWATLLDITLWSIVSWRDCTESWRIARLRELWTEKTWFRMPKTEQTPTISSPKARWTLLATCGALSKQTILNKANHTLLSQQILSLDILNSREVSDPISVRPIHMGLSKILMVLSRIRMATCRTPVLVVTFSQPARTTTLTVKQDTILTDRILKEVKTLMEATDTKENRIWTKEC